MFKVILALMISLLSFACFAETGVDLAQPPVWIADVLNFLATIPLEIGGVKVGALVVTALKWVATIGAVATAASVAVSGIMMTIQGVLKVPQVIAMWSGAVELEHKLGVWSQKVQELNLVIQPWLKYISVFNVNKPALK